MSRIDLQNIYGEGNRIEGEKLVRISDKENNTFQLPARWPTPEYAVNNVKLLKEKLLKKKTFGTLTDSQS